MRKQQIVPALGHRPASSRQGPRLVRSPHQILPQGYSCAPGRPRSLPPRLVPVGASSWPPTRGYSLMTYSVRETIHMSSESSTTSPARNLTEVIAIHGADPEILAYAMAKYSRSALSMRDSLAEISAQRAEQFLNTFYFEYGHRSIADLAHIPFAVERLSLLAAIVLVDETRWDGQERSTRYQDFRGSGWYTPGLGKGAGKQFTAAIQALFHGYDEIGAGMFEALKKAIPQPEEMKPESYART